MYFKRNLFLLLFIFFFSFNNSIQSKANESNKQNLKIRDTNQSIRVLFLETRNVNSKQINLTWSSNHPELVDYYKIYRSDQTGFTCNTLMFIDTTSQCNYTDTNLTVNQNYYYKVAAVDFSVQNFHHPLKLTLTHIF